MYKHTFIQKTINCDDNLTFLEPVKNKTVNVYDVRTVKTV